MELYYVVVNDERRYIYKVAISDMEIAINYLIKTEYGELSD